MNHKRLPEQGADETEYDALVIGGGYAGLSAMQVLNGKKVRSLLCEARNAPGGRTILAQKRADAGDEVKKLPPIAERGAFFVYTRAMKERLEAAGVEVVEFPHDAFYKVSDDKKIIPSGPEGGPVDHARIISKEIAACPNNISYDKFFASSKAYQALSDNDQKAVHGLFEADIAGPLNEAGISSAIHDAQTVGDNSDDFFGICTKGGLSTLAKKMAENIPQNARRMSTQIRTIRVNDEGGFDFGMGESEKNHDVPATNPLRAKSGILTVPITAISGISVTKKDGDTLSLYDAVRPEVRRALDMIGAGEVVKIGLMLKRPFIEGKRMLHVSVSPPDSGPIRCASVRALPVTHYDNESGEPGQMLLMYLGGTQARDFKNYCRNLGQVPQGEKLQKIKESAVSYLHEYLGIDPDIIADDPIDISGWHPDQGGRTAYSYIKAGGGPVTYNPRAAFKESILPSSMPPLYLAGEAYSETGATLTTGAFDSGVLAAENVGKMLSVPETNT